MNMSFAGNNLWQVGGGTNQFVVSTDGALVFTEAGNSDPLHPFTLKNQAHESILGETYSNLMQQSYATLTKESLELQRSFETAFNNYDTSAIDAFLPGNNYYSTNMLAVAECIALRRAAGPHTPDLVRELWRLGSSRGTAAKPDRHVWRDDARARRLSKALETLGLEDSVITYTATEFGRTLAAMARAPTTPGKQSLIFGGPVQGGRIYGTFPDLTSDGPGLSAMADACCRARPDGVVRRDAALFGVSSTDLATVLPNITELLQSDLKHIAPRVCEGRDVELSLDEAAVFSRMDRGDSHGHPPSDGMAWTSPDNLKPQKPSGTPSAPALPPPPRSGYIGGSILKDYAAPNRSIEDDLTDLWHALKNFALLVKGSDPIPLAPMKSCPCPCRQEQSQTRLPSKD